LPYDAARVIRGLHQGQRSALVVSECQRGVVDPDGAIFPGLAEQCAARGVLPRIVALAEQFRAAGLLVVHAHVVHRPDYRGFASTSLIAALSRRDARMIAGSRDVEPMPPLLPTAADHVSARHSGLGMWYGTDLDSTLRNDGVETIVFTGVSTNVALFAGAIGAVDRGYQAVLAEDASAGASAEAHDWMVANTFPLLTTIATAAEVGEAIAGASA
jgi:nicotinamidase-related amidase